MQLAKQANEVQLIVRDSGGGFDIEAAKRGRGLGLTSMKERLELVNAGLTVESEPGQGATILARAPLSTKTKSAKAGE